MWHPFRKRTAEADEILEQPAEFDVPAKQPSISEPDAGGPTNYMPPNRRNRIRQAIAPEDMRGPFTFHRLGIGESVWVHPDELRADKDWKLWLNPQPGEVSEREYVYLEMKVTRTVNGYVADITRVDGEKPVVKTVATTTDWIPVTELIR